MKTPLLWEMIRDGVPVMYYRLHVRPHLTGRGPTRYRPFMAGVPPHNESYKYVRRWRLLHIRIIAAIFSAIPGLIFWLGYLDWRLAAGFAVVIALSFFVGFRYGQDFNAWVSRHA